jgi:hypothetical protein
MVVLHISHTLTKMIINLINRLEFLFQWVTIHRKNLLLENMLMIMIHHQLLMCLPQTHLLMLVEIL